MLWYMKRSQPRLHTKGPTRSCTLLHAEDIKYQLDGLVQKGMQPLDIVGLVTDNCANIKKARNSVVEKAPYQHVLVAQYVAHNYALADPASPAALCDVCPLPMPTCTTATSIVAFTWRAGDLCSALCYNSMIVPCSCGMHLLSLIMNALVKNNVTAKECAGQLATMVHSLSASHRALETLSVLRRDQRITKGLSKPNATRMTSLHEALSRVIGAKKPLMMLLDKHFEEPGGLVTDKVAGILEDDMFWHRAKLLEALLQPFAQAIMAIQVSLQCHNTNCCMHCRNATPTWQHILRY